MSKTKVVAVGKTKLVALGVGGFLAWLIFGAKKASARTLSVPKVPKSDEVVIDERPAAQEAPTPAPATPPAKPKAPAKKPAGGKPAGKAKPGDAVVEMTAEQAQAALDQVWPLIDGGRADRDTITAALRWAQQVGDVAKQNALNVMLGGP